VPDFVITLLLAAHLLAMNVASAGPLVGVWLARRPEGVGLPSGHGLMWLSLAALVAGSLLGGALLLFPHPALRAALTRFPASEYGFAGLELVFSAGCMVALIVNDQAIGKRRFIAWGLALLSATNLLYHFPPLMAVIGELAANPAWATAEQIDRAVLLRLWRRPEVLALWVHFVLASMAVAPIAALMCLKRQSQDKHAAAGAITRRLGAWALAATALQIPAGLWLLSTNTNAARDSMLGSDVTASVCFAGGVLAALWLLQTLVTVALGDEVAAAHRAGLLVVLVTVLMTGTLRTSRSADTERASRADPIREPRDHAKFNGARRTFRVQFAVRREP
jgi:hypothetical protein